MKTKTLNVFLILTSLIGYLEWGAGDNGFLVTMEVEILVKLFTDPMSAVHPLTLIPLAGQLILLITLFQKNPSRALSLIGLACIGLLLLFIFIIGVMALNWKIFLSTFPFVILGFISLRHHWKRKVKTA